MPSDEPRYTEQEAHAHFAVALNNLVWTLLEKKDRVDEDNDLMVHAAHASMYHWSIVGKPENKARGEWLVSRVYAVLQSPEPAVHHALASLDICTDNHLEGFDIAYAHEACARAYAAGGDVTQCHRYSALAVESGEKIGTEGDRTLFFSDLKSEPWFGMLDPHA
jgi:hypothetical protein